MVTHDCPAGVVHAFGPRPREWAEADLARSERHAQRLQRIVDAVQPSHLMHGHLHMAYQRVCDFGYGPVEVTGLDRDGGRGPNWAGARREVHDLGSAVSNPIVNQQSTQVTQHRASVFLTSDLAIEFTVFDHHNSQVPQEAWDGFVTGYRHAHGTDPASSLRQYVTERSVWQWDTTYSDGAVVIGDPDGPLVLEDEAGGPGGLPESLRHEGDPYDTGLRVWGEEAGIITWLLRDKKTRKD